MINPMPLPQTLMRTHTGRAQGGLGHHLPNQGGWAGRVINQPNQGRRAGTVYRVSLYTGSVDLHIFVDPDPGRQNLADPTDPDTKN